MDRMGVASSCTQDVAYTDQVNRGICSHPIPLILMRWTVVMKFRPVSMEAMPRTNAASMVTTTLVWVSMLKGT